MPPQLNWLEHPTYAEIGEQEDPLWSSYRVCKFKSCFLHKIGRFGVQSTGGAPYTNHPFLSAIADGIVVCQILRSGEVVISSASCAEERWCESNLTQPYARLVKWLRRWVFIPETGFRLPYRVPDSNNWFCQNIEALILNSLLRGTTTVITITNKLFLGQPRGQVYVSQVATERPKAGYYSHTRGERLLNMLVQLRGRASAL